MSTILWWLCPELFEHAVNIAGGGDGTKAVIGAILAKAIIGKDVERHA